MSRRLKIVLAILGGFTGLCILCLAFAFVYNLTPAGRASATQGAQTSTAESLTETARPTETTRPTETEPPTNTPRPSDTPKATETTTPTPTEIPTPTETPTLSAAFELLYLSSPISINNDAAARIRTIPGAACSIVYVSPGGSVSQAEGLEPQTAGENGICSWTWRIGPSTAEGEGSVSISANGLTLTFPIVVQ